MIEEVKERMLPAKRSKGCVLNVEVPEAKPMEKSYEITVRAFDADGQIPLRYMVFRLPERPERIRLEIDCKEVARQAGD